MKENKKMKKKADLLINFPIRHKRELEKRIEFHNHKITPQPDNIFPANFLIEDEWQQEYYIIYNSYILDENEQNARE